MTRLTDAQVNCLREVAKDGLPSGSSRTVNSLFYKYRLIERATLGNPHPTCPYALYRLTAAGELELVGRS